MVYVPTVAPTRGVSASPRAQDLGRRLKAEIEKFESQYPGTSRKDVLAATALSVGEEPGSAPTKRRMAAAVGGVVAGLGVLAGMVVPLAESGVTKSLPLWPIGALIFALGVVTGVSVKRLRNR